MKQLVLEKINEISKTLKKKRKDRRYKLPVSEMKQEISL